MRIFFHCKIFFIRSVIGLSLTGKIYAQEIEKNDSICRESPRKSSWLYNTYKTIYDAYKYDPKYLKSEANRLKIRLLNTIQTSYFTIHPKSDINKSLDFDSEPLNYVGMDIGWNIFALGYSFSIGDKQKRVNRRFSFNTYSRFFAIDAEILWLNSLNLSNLKDFISENESIPEKIALNDAYFRSRSVRLTFFPGGKKMAYGNTINPVFRQLKSAGTLITALGYSDYDFNPHIKNIDMGDNEWLSEIGINNINLSKYELGIGYSYNFVAGSHWVLFISDMVGISAKHYSFEMLSDNIPIKETQLGGSNYFRTGACYYNKEYFIGAHISHELDILSTNKFLFNNNNQLAVLYIGYKFKVDRFNNFASNLLKKTLGDRLP